MQEFTGSHKMINLVQENPGLLPVIHRFGIRLGFGNRTVEQVCTVQHLNTAFFLAIVNTFHNPHYFREDQLLAFSPLLIVDYLQKTHAYYIGFSLPQIEQLVHRLLESIPEKNSEMKMIETFYLTYKKKLLEHIDEEEKLVFPYVEKLVRAPETLDNITFDFNFEQEHEHVDLELHDLKNLILKYMVPEYDEFICNKLLEEIYRFEKDIQDHSRIEDSILIPQVKHLLKSVK